MGRDVLIVLSWIINVSASTSCNFGALYGFSSALDESRSKQSGVVHVAGRLHDSAKNQISRLPWILASKVRISKPQDFL